MLVGLQWRICASMTGRQTRRQTSHYGQFNDGKSRVEPLRVEVWEVYGAVRPELRATLTAESLAAPLLCTNAIKAENGATEI